MPRKKSAMPSAAIVLKAIKVFEKATGQKVTAVKHHPDGTFRLMISAHVSKDAAKAAVSDWDDAPPIVPCETAA